MLAMAKAHVGRGNKMMARPNDNEDCVAWTISNPDGVHPGDAVLISYEPDDQFCRVVPLSEVTVTPKDFVLAHLQLKDGMGNKATLICRLKNGGIHYTMFSSHNSSGIPYALENLQCDLPMSKAGPLESAKQFESRLVNIINIKSVYRVANVVGPVAF